MHLNAKVTQEGALYVAQCLEVDVASQGPTIEAALENLAEALELYFEDSAEKPTPIVAIAPIHVRAAG